MNEAKRKARLATVGRRLRASAAERIRGGLVYAAVTVRDFEGEEFHGVFSTPEAACEVFSKKIAAPIRCWKWDPVSRRWTNRKRGGTEVYEVRSERVG